MYEKTAREDLNAEKEHRKDAAHTYPSRRWSYFILGTIAMLCIGTIYGWSVLKVPLGETFGWETGQLALAYSLMFCAFCAGNIGGSQLQKKLGHRAALILSAAAVAAGFTLTAALDTPNILMLYLSYSLLVGGGIGVAYPTILDQVGRWFPDMPGLCSGVLTMGFGSSTLFLVQPVSGLFQVSGVGWRGAFLILGAAGGGSLLLCALCLKSRFVEKAQGQDARGFPVTQTMRRPDFWRLYAYLLLNSVLGSVIFALAYDYCVSLEFSIVAAVTMVSVVSAFNGLSRPLFGMVYDRLGRKRTMLAGSLCVILASFTMLLAVLLRSKPLAVLGLALTGLGYGYGPVLNPTLIRAFYGDMDFAANYSLSNTRTLITSFMAPAFAKLLAVTGSFVAPLLITLGTSCAAFVLQFSIRSPSPLPQDH